MAKLFKRKYKSEDVAVLPTDVDLNEVLMEESEEYVEEEIIPSTSYDDVEEKYFGKSLSYLTKEKRNLEQRQEELNNILNKEKQAYSVLLDRRKQVSAEQQQALSDYNEVSLDSFENEMPNLTSPNNTNHPTGDKGAFLDQKKLMLQGMKDVENEKEDLSALIEDELFKKTETIISIQDEIENINSYLTSIDKAISVSGHLEEELEPLEGDASSRKNAIFSKIKAKRKVANKVKGINFLNLPTYLKNDCEMEYATTKLILNYVIVFIVIALLGILYSLKWPYVLILCLIYFIFGPSIIYFNYRKKYEKKKFTACVRYIEQMIFSFTRHSKLLNALQETRVLLTGKIGDAVDNAIVKIQHGKGSKNLYQEALHDIEEIYPCGRVKNLHEMLIDVERVGGKYSSALDIMLEDVREWDVRTNNFQQEQTVKGISIIISILMSLGVCFFMSNILPDDMGGDISGFAVYQVVTTLSLIIMFFIYRFSARKLTSSWVSDDLGEDAAQIKSDYDKVKKYVDNPEGKIKPIFAITRIQTAMEKAFPRWVMRFSLLASNNTVSVALSESTNSAPLVMKEELERLSVNLEENPADIQPYVDFFKGFDLPQVHSMMMMVYSLGSADTKDIEKHILSIVKRNHLLQAAGEKIEYDEKMAMFTLFSTVPMLLACVIMMVDVAMIVFNMLNTVL